MRGLFITTNGYDPKWLVAANFQKAAVQDQLSNAKQIIASLRGLGVRTSVWTDDPDSSIRLLSFGADEIIVQAEDHQAEAAVLNIAALRSSDYRGLLSVVTNMWPSRNYAWFDRFLHHNSVRMLVECYLPDSANLKPANMLQECHDRGFPSAQPVLGLYRGFTLDNYPDRGHDYWVWDAAQMAPGDWARM